MASMIEKTVDPNLDSTSVKGSSEDVSLLPSMQDSGIFLDLQVTADLSSLNQELSELLDVKNTLRTPPPTTECSPFECHALQQDEFRVLMSIYGNDMLALNEDGTCFVINIKFLSDEIKEEDVIKIWFSLPANYPSVPPVFEIETNQSGSFDYRDADDLFDLLMENSLNHIGGMMIFNLVNLAQEHMPELIKKKDALALKREQEDEERKKKIDLEDAFKKSSKKTIPDELIGESMPESQVGTSERNVPMTSTKKEEEEEGSWKCYQDNKPRQYIGSISDIVKKIPTGMQITRIENVMRGDLAARFRHAAKEMNESLWQKERTAPQMYNLTPQIAFHGTRAKSLPSIVHRGLLIPSEGSDVQVRSGSSLGVGIYLSPSAEFSFSYSDSSRLIVCAVLLGRIYKGGYNNSDHFPRYHSIISSDGFEWVIFNAAQVLPCYVIQLHRGGGGGGGGSKPCHDPVPPPLTSLLEGSHDHRDVDVSEVERRAKLQARSHKFLPFGYGPGAKTVIEDAASIDDDEEDYGDYQLLRYDGVETLYRDGVTVVQTDLQRYRFKHPEEKSS